MPFYKKMCNTKSINEKILHNKVIENSDDCAIVNKHLIQIMGHIAELYTFSNDVFGSVENECRNIFERTQKLMTKIERCQEAVDKLNAKTVTVPVGSLSQQQALPSVNRHVEQSYFASFPRPPFVDRMRQLAHGPSPPAIIPLSKVAPEADSPTHIYCKPLSVKYSEKNLGADPENLSEKNMTSSKVTSSVVPIDVSGQSFSRMASFRRSLIHVDFLIRRKKKKDKRRNTVAEGDTNELKDALHNFMSKENQYITNNPCSEQTVMTPLDAQNGKACNNKYNVHNAEKNNNTKENSYQNSSYSKATEMKFKDEDKTLLSNNGEFDNMNIDGAAKLPTSKKKSKSNIPISTISAAMSVAVKMRQSNNIKSDNSSSSNWSSSSDQNSSDSEKTKCKDDFQKSIIKNNLKVYDKENFEHGLENFRFKISSESPKNAEKILNDRNGVIKGFDSSSSASSEYSKNEDLSYSTSTESDAFFISSDESDEGSPEIAFFHEKYGSLTSLSTLSDGSLNSLLSQTVSEITSSTSTLTSIGEEKLPSIPSNVADEPIILQSRENSTNESIKSKKQDGNKNLVKQNLLKSSKKQKTVQKQSKLMKPEISDKNRTSSENSKNIFSSFANIKTNMKERQKSKSVESSENKKLNELNSQPSFDMYGNTSPKKFKLQTFKLDNVPHFKEHSTKVPMQSFSPHNTRLESSIKAKNIGFGHSSLDSAESSTLTKNSEPTESKKTDLNEKSRTETNKYEHCIKVTPLQRHTYHTIGGSSCDKTMAHKDKHNELCDAVSKVVQINKPEKRVNSLKNNEKYAFSKTSQLEKPKLAAHVVLDFEGRVIYCTNSLDRKTNEDSMLNGFYDHHKNNNKGVVSCRDRALQFTHSKSANLRNSFSNHSEQPKSISAPSRKETFTSSSISNSYSSPKTSSSNQQKFSSNINLPEKVHENSNVYEMCNPKYFISETRADIELERKRYSENKKQDKHSIILPDPNISGLPESEVLLTQHNVNIHSKRMENFDFSQNDKYNQKQDFDHRAENCTDDKAVKPQSTMSTEDLFAVIHSCKKRMNIKTASDVSLTSSSRSSSPSFTRPASKGTLVETGFLSPRNHMNTPGYRRSWSGFRSTENTERKSLASDRLGPTKPTSMHDFKMLLLQARSNNKSPGPRKSAVEMLKVPLSNEAINKITEEPLNLFPQHSVSFSAQNSPTSDILFPSGHSTVPFKRGNRTRSSLQTRYTIYPPIFEDCSEDSENYRELSFQNNSLKTFKEIQSDIGSKHKKCMTHNLNKNFTNSRHWI